MPGMGTGSSFQRPSLWEKTGTFFFKLRSFSSQERLGALSSPSSDRRKALQCGSPPLLTPPPGCLVPTPAKSMQTSRWSFKKHLNWGKIQFTILTIFWVDHSGVLSTFTKVHSHAPEPFNGRYVWMEERCPVLRVKSACLSECPFIFVTTIFSYYNTSP